MQIREIIPNNLQKPNRNESPLERSIEREEKPISFSRIFLKKAVQGQRSGINQAAGSIPQQQSQGRTQVQTRQTGAGQSQVQRRSDRNANDNKMAQRPAAAKTENNAQAQAKSQAQQQADTISQDRLREEAEKLKTPEDALAANVQQQADQSGPKEEVSADAERNLEQTAGEIDLAQGAAVMQTETEMVAWEDNEIPSEKAGIIESTAPKDMVAFTKTAETETEIPKDLKLETVQNEAQPAGEGAKMPETMATENPEIQQNIMAADTDKAEKPTKEEAERVQADTKVSNETRAEGMQEVSPSDEGGEEMQNKNPEAKVVQTAHKSNATDKKEAENSARIFRPARQVEPPNVNYETLSVQKAEQIHFEIMNRNISQVTKPIAKQVADGLVANMKILRAGEAVEMDLEPKALGKVRMKLTVEKGIVEAQIKVENQTVKAAVEAGLADLKQSLGEKGYEVKEISVDVRSDEGFGQHLARDNQGENQGRNSRSKSKYNEYEESSGYQEISYDDRLEMEDLTINYYG